MSTFDITGNANVNMQVNNIPDGESVSFSHTFCVCFFFFLPADFGLCFALCIIPSNVCVTNW